MKRLNVSDGEYLLISPHAKKRMEERGVSEDEVIQTFTSPDAIWDHISGKTKNYQKEIAEHSIKIGVKLRKNNKHILVTTMKKESS